jgi:uncharacterized membrane protein
VLRLLFPGLEEPPNLPFVGAIFTLLVILLCGVVARHLFGREIVRLWEQLLSRVPVARTIYAAVKQLVDAVFGSGSQASFRRVVLIEFPRTGVYSIGFITGSAPALLGEGATADLVNVFVPTTPNPTTGFFLMVPERDLSPPDHRGPGLQAGDVSGSPGAGRSPSPRARGRAAGAAAAAEPAGGP